MKVESGTSQLAPWQLWDSERACCSFYLLRCTELRLSEISGNSSRKEAWVSGIPCLWGMHPILDKNSTAEEPWGLEEPDRDIGVTGTYLKPFSYPWSVEHSLLSAHSHKRCVQDYQDSPWTLLPTSPSNAIGSTPIIYLPVSHSSPTGSIRSTCTRSLSLFPHWASFAC